LKVRRYSATFLLPSFEGDGGGRDEVFAHPETVVLKIKEILDNRETFVRED